MQQTGIRWGFLAAWAMLVVVISAGFYIQARTIHRLERDEQTIAQAAEDTERQQTENAEVLCGLLVRIAHDDTDKALIIKTFYDLGYQCTLPVAGG